MGWGEGLGARRRPEAAAGGAGVALAGQAGRTSIRESGGAGRGGAGRGLQGPPRRTIGADGFINYK